METVRTKIAAWKIDSEEERRLAELADHDEQAKKDYVEFYRVNDPVYYEKGLKMIDKTLGTFRGALTDAQRERYTIDMVYSLHRFGCSFDEYFLLGFELLNAYGRGEFVTDKNRFDFFELYNDEDRHFMSFKDKSKTYELFQKFYKRDFLALSGEDDYKCFCEFRRRHSDFVVKPLYGSGGRGIYKYIYNADQRESGDDSDMALFHKLLEDGPVALEEVIKQDERMEALHPGSVNTVRIPTVRKKDGSVALFHPLLRAGMGDAVIDNGTSGGIMAPVDPETGIVTQKGITFDGKTYLVHPDTKTIIPGFQIPRWDEAVEMVRELAKVVEGVRYVGWDCALTESGWLMVEGNIHGQFGEQYATRRGVKRELEELLK